MSLKDISLKKVIDEITVVVDPKEVVRIIEKQIDNYSLVICTTYNLDYPYIYDDSIHINLPKVKAKEIIAKVLLHRIFYHNMQEADYQLYLKTLMKNGILNNEIDPTTCRRRDAKSLFSEHIELNKELNGFETYRTKFYFTSSKDQTIQNIISCILEAQFRCTRILDRDYLIDGAYDNDDDDNDSDNDNDDSYDDDDDNDSDNDDDDDSDDDDDDSDDGSDDE